MSGTSREFDIDEGGLGPGVEDAVGRGDEGEGRYQDLVPWTDPQRPHHQMKARRAGADGDRVGYDMLVGERSFEGAHSIAHRDPAAADDFGQRRLLILAQTGLCDQ